VALTFAVAGVVAQHRTFFDRSERLKQKPHVILVLLLVQHPDKQLSIFYNQPHVTRQQRTLAVSLMTTTHIDNMNCSTFLLDYLSGLKQ